MVSSWGCCSQVRLGEEGVLGRGRTYWGGVGVDGGLQVWRNWRSHLAQLISFFFPCSSSPRLMYSPISLSAEEWLELSWLLGMSNSPPIRPHFVSSPPHPLS